MACARIRGGLLRRLADGRRQWIRGGARVDRGTDGGGRGWLRSRFRRREAGGLPTRAPIPSIRGPPRALPRRHGAPTASPLWVASARGAWPSPSSSSPRRRRASHGDPPPRTWFQHRLASSLLVPAAAELRRAPLLSLHRGWRPPSSSPSSSRRREGLRGAQ
jgi:hypothetical protein